MRRIRRKKKQAMIEFVLVIGVFLFLIGFMFTGFQIMHNKMIFNIAAYEGARGSIVLDPVSGSYGSGLNQAENLLSHTIGTTSASVNITNNGTYVTCKVSGTMKPLFPMIGFNGFNSLNSEMVMRLERRDP